MARKRKGKGLRRTSKANPKGIFEGNARGFGFIKTSEGDFFIPRSGVNGAMDGDLVEVSVTGRGRNARSHGWPERRSEGSARPEARVVSILNRATSTIIGRYEVAGPFGVVIPDDPRIRYDIFTKRSEGDAIEDGSLVKLRLLEYPTRRSSAFGVVEEVIGDAEDAALISQKVIARYGFETEFSTEALAEAQGCAVDAEGALEEGYRDLRERLVLTIDPADARDFDDALSIERIEADRLIGSDAFLLEDAHALVDRSQGIWRLGVHIADVAHYVGWGSAIDTDARKRATSVYLPDRVIPMIPESLSNGICSLQPGAVRRAFTVDVYLTDSCEVIGYDPYPSLIESKARLSYEEAERIIVEGVDDAGRAGLVVPLQRLAGIAQKLLRRRIARGALEFATSEAKVLLDDAGHPEGIAIRSKTVSTSLVEEAMILANEVVAAHLSAVSWPCAYRVHESPSFDALAVLAPVLAEFGWFTKEMAAGLSAANPHAIQGILEACAGRAEEELVSMLVLRAMKRAEYAAVNIGHFGIGSAAYCHFTSPIRRYPDLIVHRMLRANLTKRPERFSQEANAIKELCRHASAAERDAEAASMDATKGYIACYLQDRIGTVYEGLVTGVTNHGLYVRVEDFAEGLVPIRSLGDEYFRFDETRFTLTGESTHASYRLGQRLEVMLVEASMRDYRLRFQPVDAARTRGDFKA